MDKKIIEKIKCGDGLTERELDTALCFYRDLKEKLTLLGPEFHLATVAVIHTLVALESFHWSRHHT
jgi:hypothetical protein